ncbi:DUF58 domain-containing protein [Actinoplanes sp. NPDC051411]|uniref:DUF58 domain-containing protein n=1 Tax=Actinoplanes sp. NPDC051411 TaxID=3155522 RepID=UPI00342DCD07
MTSAPETPAHWASTRAFSRAVLLSGLFTLLGVALGRVDMVMLAAPFAIGAALGLRRLPSVTPTVRVAAGDENVVEGDVVDVALTVTNPDVVSYDLVVVRTAMSPWLELEHGDRPFALAAPGGRQADVELPGEALHWGRQEIGPAVASVTVCGGLIDLRPSISPARGVRVYPATQPFGAVEAMPAAAGLVGNHRSRRPGDGGELEGVRRFAAGDRLRRIDWRVSLRTRDLYVAATSSDRDAEVLLLLDVLGDVGPSGGIRGRPSAVDTTVRAAAAIAEHYLKSGDRVALFEYGRSGRRLRPAGGRRQYVVVREWLLDVQAGSTLQQSYDGALSNQRLSPNALVIVLTPLVDPRSAGMLATLARSGRHVIAVDTLPPDAAPPVRGPWTPTATELWRLERENVLSRLQEHGVPVVAWAGAGSLDLVLRGVSRLASAPRGR